MQGSFCSSEVEHSEDTNQRLGLLHRLVLWRPRFLVLTRAAHDALAFL